MDHSFIEETNQVDRYVRGTMDPAERAAFEEHFLDCPDCLAQLEIARSLRESVRIAAADESSSQHATSARSRRRIWNWITAAAVAGLAAAAVTIVVLYQHLDHTRRELNRTQLAYAHEREGSAGTLQNGEPIIYSLSLSRGSVVTPKSIEVPRSPRWVVFSIQIDASQYPSYRATLRDSSGNTVWQKEDIAASSADTIAIPIPSTAIEGGEYTLILDGRNPTGTYVQVSSFMVAATKQR